MSLMELTHAGLRPALRATAPTATPAAPGALLAGVKRAGLTIWRALEAHGRRRATRELRRLALPMELLQPERSRELRAAVRYLVSD